MKHLKHNIPPIFNENSKILILGSFPSPKSRENEIFYGNPQNRFWLVLAKLFNEPTPETKTDKKDFFFGALIFIKALPPKKVAWLDGSWHCVFFEKPVYVFH